MTSTFLEKEKYFGVLIEADPIRASHLWKGEDGSSPVLFRSYEDAFTADTHFDEDIKTSVAEVAVLVSYPANPEGSKPEPMPEFREGSVKAMLHGEEAIALLRECSDALNQIRNTRLTGENKDSYALASKLDKFFREYEKDPDPVD